MYTNNIFCYNIIFVKRIQIFLFFYLAQVYKGKNNRGDGLIRFKLDSKTRISPGFPAIIILPPP